MYKGFLTKRRIFVCLMDDSVIFLGGGLIVLKGLRCFITCGQKENCGCLWMHYPDVAHNLQKAGRLGGVAGDGWCIKLKAGDWRFIEIPSIKKEVKTMM
jgi:hypothetical protein